MKMRMSSPCSGADGDWDQLVTAAGLSKGRTGPCGQSCDVSAWPGQTHE